MLSKSGKITLKDLSAHTGVSATAISHILNDRLGNVRASFATQQRVLLAAKELGYVPRLQARSMATRRSYAIGVVASLSRAMDPYAASYFTTALQAIEEICRASNYHCIFVASALDDPARFVEPRMMKDGSVDGVILLGLASRRVAARILQMGLPCMQVGNNVDPAIGIESISSDVDASVEQICRRLIKLGHRRIEFALPPGPGPERHLAQFRALAQRIAGFDPRPVNIANYVPTADDGRARAREALAASAGTGSTAFICTAPHAHGLVSEMNAAGKVMARDYSVVTLLSEEIAPLLLGPDQVPATAIALPTAAVARRAAERLFERLNSNDVAAPPPQASAVPCRIIEGETCGPAPGLPPESGVQS